jgi:predicted transcriptional regulator
MHAMDMGREEFCGLLKLLGPVAVARFAGCSRYVVYAYRDGRRSIPRETSQRLRKARWDPPTANEIEQRVWNLGGNAAAARAIGVSDTAVYRWRKGLSKLSRAHAERLRELAVEQCVAGITPREFIARVERVGAGFEPIARRYGWTSLKSRRFMEGEIPMPREIVDAMDEFEKSNVH